MTTRWQDHIPFGTHAARPAADATGLPAYSLYACSDHGKVYITDGADWSDWYIPDVAAAPAPWAVVPHMGTSSVADQAVASNNQAVIVPITIPAAVTVTGVLYRVVTSSGNVSVALYDESLNQLATSGSVACPTAGMATTTFGTSYAAAPGRYWLGFSSSTTAASFRAANLSGHNTFLAKTAGTSHPLPDPFVPTSSDSRAPLLVGLVSGGWAP